MCDLQRSVLVRVVHVDAQLVCCIHTKRSQSKHAQHSADYQTAINQWSLVWRSGNSVDLINKAELHRAQLVLRLATIFDWSTVQVFYRPTQPGHPAVNSRCNE